MLAWAILLIILIIIAGMLAFGGFPIAATGMAKMLFFLFLVVLFIGLVYSFMGRGPPPPE